MSFEVLSVLLSVLVRTCIKVCIEHTHMYIENIELEFFVIEFTVFSLSHSLSLPRTVRNSKLPLNLRFLSSLFSVFILASARHSFHGHILKNHSRISETKMINYTFKLSISSEIWGLPFIARIQIGL